QPRAVLAAVDAERLQTALDALRQRGGGAVEVVEDEHRHAPGLAVAGDGELQGGRGSSRGLPQRREDPVELPGGPVAEEGKRDVEVLARDDPDTGERGELPGLDCVERRFRKAEAEEETEPLIPTHAIPGIHAASSELCVRRRRTRWSAP